MQGAGLIFDQYGIVPYQFRTVSERDSSIGGFKKNRNLPYHFAIIVQKLKVLGMR